MGALMAPQRAVAVELPVLIAEPAERAVDVRRVAQQCVGHAIMLAVDDAEDGVVALPVALAVFF